MLSNRAAGAVLGLPLAFALAFTTAGCDTEDSKTRTQGTSSPSTSAPGVSTNGVDKLSASQAYARARAATLGASSIRVRGQYQNGTFKLDYRHAGRR